MGRRRANAGGPGKGEAIGLNRGGGKVNEQIERVNALVERVERHQAALKLNDSQFVARYRRHLSSVDSWGRRLKARKWDELGKSLNKWDKRLTAFVSELDGGASVETFFEKLPIARYGQQVFEVLQGTRSDRRCAMLVATYGCGKTVTLRHLSAKHPATTAYLRANETWKNSPMQIASGMARALGVGEQSSAANTFLAVLEHLKANPITLLIDEFHEGGVLLMKLVKTIIDESMAKVVIATYPTALKRLQAASNEALAEAQQLLGRTMKPIRMDWARGLRREDVEIYLREATGLDGDAKRLAEALTPVINRGGSYRCLADAVDLARINADADEVELDAEMVEAAVHELAPKEVQ
jgi:hypothetical protein